MVRIILAQEFEKQYQRLPLSIQKRAEKQTDIFSENPFHPSLHSEKLQIKRKQLWSLRVDKRYRVLFRFLEKNTALFLSIGPHDWIYKISLHRY